MLTRSHAKNRRLHTAARGHFSKEISEKVTEPCRAPGIEPPDKATAKVHLGEQGNQDFPHPEFRKTMAEAVHGTVVERSVAYGDAPATRDNTEPHLRLLEEHGQARHFDVGLMDTGGRRRVWPVPDSKVPKENEVGKSVLAYDSELVLARFKGHPMGGGDGRPDHRRSSQKIPPRDRFHSYPFRILQRKRMPFGMTRLRFDAHKSRTAKTACEIQKWHEHDSEVEAILAFATPSTS